MESSTIKINMPSFQKKRPPAWLRKASLVAKSGRAPIKVPDGHRYLQNAGTLAKPVNKKAEPMIARPKSAKYLPYFRIE